MTYMDRSMREKKKQLIITFPTTAAAMAMEKLCRREDMPGRLIPVPREITAGCGMAWCAPVEARVSIEAVLQTANLQPDGCYEMMV